MARQIEFKMGENQLMLGLADCALILYYAKQLDFNKGANLYYRFLSEYFYKYYKTLSSSNNDSEYSCYYDATEIQNAINFMQNDIIPALNSETIEYLVDKYGGKEQFLNLFSTNRDYIEILPDMDEFWGFSPEDFKDRLVELIVILQDSLNASVAYMVETR